LRWDWKGAETDTAENIVNSAKAKNLNIIAITDHNWFGGYAKVSETAKRLTPDMLVLPGVEFTVKEPSGTKVHIVAIFDGDGNARGKIESLLNEGGVEFDKIDETKGKQSIDRITLPVLIEKIDNMGGVSIAAHIDEKSGIRKEMKDYNKEDLVKLLKKSELHAIQVKNSKDAKYYDGTDENYDNVKKTCVKTSDAHDIQSIGRTYTRFKMEKLDFESLKKAIKDRDTRVRFDDELLESNYHKILGMNIHGNYFKDVNIVFNQSLNCFVGGKGTGKTAILELLRYALQVHVPSNKVDSINQAIAFWLGGGGRVTVLVESADGKQYIVTRTYGQPASTIFDMDGKQVQIDMNSGENFGIDIKGWGEIEHTAVNPEEQLSLLDSFDEVKTIDANLRRINSIREHMESGFYQILSLKKRKTMLQAEVNDLLDKQEKIKALDKFGLQSVQADFESMIKEKKLIETLSRSVQQEQTESQLRIFKDLTNTVTDIKTRIPTESTITKTELDDLIANAERTLMELAEMRRQEQEKLSSLKAVMDCTCRKIEEKHTGVEQAYRTKLAELTPELQTEAQRRENLIIDVASLPEKQRQLTETDREIERNSQSLAKNLEDLQESVDTISDTRKNIAKTLSDKIGLEVRVSIQPHANRNKVLEARSRISQPIQQTFSDLIAQFDREKPQELYAAIYRKDISKLVALTGVQEERIKNFVDLIMNDENFIHAMKAVPEDVPLIELKLKGINEYRRVENLSSGQRCTAVLPIVLHQGKRPLVIDQPEDNLDNAYIFSVVVDNLRKRKEKQQIFVTTHNPNIVVSGDAEMVFVMESDGMIGYIAHRGYVDSREITKQILAIVEGGKEAFLIRKEKYGY
jgi:energy-coupling factor transporter ATP-binding protein EcfA2/histidinol phosphatase-like PHP family hydrolase